MQKRINYRNSLTVAYHLYAFLLAGQFSIPPKDRPFRGVLCAMMDEIASDGALVARAVEGDRAAFAALVSRHYDFIFRVAWKWCGNREDAEDLAQDVCVRLGRSIISYSGNAQFSSWLYRVVVNAARDSHRRDARERARRDAFANDPLQTDKVVPAALLPSDPVEELWEAVRSLPERQREAVTLVHGESLTHAQAAEILDCAEGTVASNLHDARKALKALLNPGEGTKATAAHAAGGRP